MTPPFTIRKTTPEDNPQRFVTTQIAWRDAYTHIFTPEEMEAVWSGRIPHHHPADELREDYIGGYVAEVEGQIVGHVMLAMLKDGRGEVAALYVRPLQQGIGIGRGLWRVALDDLKQRGCQEANVWVLAKGPAVGFYEKMGCTRFAEGVFSLGEHGEAVWGYRIKL